MYELETVGRKFGGKYAKKIVSANDMAAIDKYQAKEMGIEVCILNKDVRVKNFNR